MSKAHGDITRRALLAAAGIAPAAPSLEFQSSPIAAVPEQQDWRARVWTVSEINALRLNRDPGVLLARRISLTGAKWIWLPCQRTLPCTVVLFRKAVLLEYEPRRADAWITADSRYRLFVNGERVQWGPAPCDPRQLDVDSVDLLPYLKPGRNVIAVEVLYYGVGDGTWPAGKPGMLFHMTLEGPERKTIVSDDSWLCLLDRAHPPGQYKRWFLRAFQEEFDARYRPEGWSDPEYEPGEGWVRAAVLRCPPDKPASSAPGPYSGDTIDAASPDRSSLRVREIPPVKETEELAVRLADSGRVLWSRNPDDWFQMRMPNCFRIERGPGARATGEREWELQPTADPRTGIFATFALPAQMVGFPVFTIDAPAGTVVEMMTQESHDPAKTAWLDTHHFSWSRWICREGENKFEALDYESLRWIQFHVRGASRAVRIRDIGMRRRQYAWPHDPHIRTSDKALQRVLDAAINTVRNSVIETVVDGMGRERQQYSGDCGHQLHAVRYAFGDTFAPRRFLRTFSEGQMQDGYFADCWPAYDRLARVAQKEMDGAYWGPLLDHGVGFNFDCWNHYLETGDHDALVEPWPRLRRFAMYIESLLGREDVIPVVDLGIPTVWMDHEAFEQQKHKQCSFNLYFAAMLRQALAPIAQAFGDAQYSTQCLALSDRILGGTIRRYWSNSRKLFIDNLPWVESEGRSRMSDRTLAMAVLFDLCPSGATDAAVEALASPPDGMGLSYPANANWRYWALAKGGRIQPVLDDFRRRWATMRSVVENSAIQENWTAEPDSTAQWSHCAVAPLYVAYMDIAGIRPLEPGFSRCRIRPQLGDLPDLELTAHTVRGPVEFKAVLEGSGHRLRVTLPKGCEAELVVPGKPVQKVPGGGTVDTVI